MKKEMEEKKEMKATDISCLYDSIKAILSNARQQAYRAVNFAMVKSYWLGSGLWSMNSMAKQGLTMGKGC